MWLSEEVDYAAGVVEEVCKGLLLDYNETTVNAICKGANYKLFKATFQSYRVSASYLSDLQYDLC